MVAILIFALGAGVSIYDGIHRVLHPQSMTNVLINYIVLGLAIMFEAVAWYMTVTEFAAQKAGRSYMDAIHHAKDPTIFVG